jgi:hypothetical protein
LGEQVIQSTFAAGGSAARCNCQEQKTANLADFMMSSDPVSWPNDSSSAARRKERSD